MPWTVLFAAAFEPEFDALPVPVQNELLAQAGVLRAFGPQAGRPRVDTLNGSKHRNMKELRFDAADGVWRVAFAFDPERMPFCSAQATSRAAASGNSIDP